MIVRLHNCSLSSTISLLEKDHVTHKFPFPAVLQYYKSRARIRHWSDYQPVHVFFIAYKERLEFCNSLIVLLIATPLYYLSSVVINEWDYSRDVWRSFACLVTSSARMELSVTSFFMPKVTIWEKQRRDKCNLSVSLPSCWVFSPAVPGKVYQQPARRRVSAIFLSKA